jgi:hypothetical protein
MLNTQDEGVFTKTQAFNFLKELLCISKRCLINRKIVFLVFEQSDGGFFIKKPESEVRNFFKARKIPELNRDYYRAIKTRDPEALRISGKIISIIRREMATT